MANQYTLAPLIKDGRDCLACADIDGMDCVVLEWVELYYGGAPWQRIIRQSDDIFALLERKVFKWPALDRMASARFRIRLKNDKRTRQITIRASKRMGDQGQEICPAIRVWLKKRKFIEAPPDAGKSLE